jgi:hypothetical protein
VLDRSDDLFYAPLQELQPQSARVYLGAIHNMPRLEERLATARSLRAHRKEIQQREKVMGCTTACMAAWGESYNECHGAVV